MLLLFPPHLAFEVWLLTELEAPHFRKTKWLMDGEYSPVSLFPGLGLHVLLLCLACLGPGDLNSDPHICLASTSPVEPYPQLLEEFFKEH